MKGKDMLVSIIFSTDIFIFNFFQINRI